MRLTTKGRFAVTAMIDVAMHGGEGPVTLAAVSERQKISLSYLEQLFGKLRRHGLGRERARARAAATTSREPPDAGFGRRHHPRGRRADRRDAMRRPGELPRRPPLHDARPVGGSTTTSSRSCARCHARASWCASSNRSQRRRRAAGPPHPPAGTPTELAGRAEPSDATSTTDASMKLPIYLDYSATTPVDPRVAQKMIPYLTEHFGNPASRSHSFGWTAEAAVEEAREHVAALVNCDPKELVWTSGATESINLALKGAAHFYKDKGKHLVTVKTEHKATLDTMRELEREGFEVTYLDVQAGRPARPRGVQGGAAAGHDRRVGDVRQQRDRRDPGHRRRSARSAARAGIIFHVDAAQATGKVPIDLAKLKVDLMSFSAHKTYGPKGVGALFVRRKPRVRIEAQMHGGGHERGMRSGTLPTHQIVGMGEAFRIAQGWRWRPRTSASACCATGCGRACRRSRRSTSTATSSSACRTTSTSSFNFVEGESADHGDQGHRGVVGLGVHVGVARAVVRAARARPQRRARAQLDPLHPRPLHDRGRDRLHDRPPQAQGREAARAVAAVGNVQGRRRPRTPIAMGGALTASEEQRDMAYSDKVLDHYENPRNVGSFAKDDDDVGTGMVGAPACGDVMKLQIKVGTDGIIEDAKFKTYGCGSAIASSSLVTEWVKGKTLDQAMTIRNTQIAEELALPPVKIHCSILAEDAIKAAVADYRKKHGAATAPRQPSAEARGRLNGATMRWRSR